MPTPSEESHIDRKELFDLWNHALARHEDDDAVLGFDDNVL